jgi:hypothetical protein
MSPPFTKNHLPADKWFIFEIYNFWLLRKLGINLLDDSIVGKTIIPVILHIDDDMLMNPDADNFSGMNDLSGNHDIVCRWLKIVGRMIATKDNR